MFLIFELYKHRHLLSTEFTEKHEEANCKNVFNFKFSHGDSNCIKRLQLLTAFTSVSAIKNLIYRNIYHVIRILNYLNWISYNRIDGLCFEL